MRIFRRTGPRLCCCSALNASQQRSCHLSYSLPIRFPLPLTYIVLALGVAELLLVSVFQHFLHHSAATPHVKHSLSMLVSHFLHYTQISSRINNPFLCSFLRHTRKLQQHQDQRDNNNILKLTAISSNLPNSRVRYLSIGGLMYSQ